MKATLSGIHTGMEEFSKFFILSSSILVTGANATSSDWQAIEFLWVRWFGQDFSTPTGFKARHLYRVGFINSKEVGAFGFLDPARVIRTCHLIPAFDLGKTSKLLRSSRFRDLKHGDWDAYFVSR